MTKSIAIAAAALSLCLPMPAQAQSGTDRYLGEIILVGMNFCPRGTFEAAGQLLPISQNSALFSLLGTQYGGDGRTTFALPDLRGRVPTGSGRGPGLEPLRQGEKRTAGGDSGHTAGGNTGHTAGVAQLGLRFCIVAQGIFPSRR